MPGELVGSREGLAYQPEGAGCRQEVRNQHDGGGRHHLDESGQSYCCCFHQPNGGNKVKVSVQDGFGFVENCSRPSGLDKGQLAPQGRESAGGLAVKGGDRYLGDISLAFGGHKTVGQVVYPVHGHVCKCQMSSSGSVLQLVSRFRGCTERCLLPGEVAKQGLLLSSCSLGRHDLGQDCAGQGGQGHSDCSSMADVPVVDQTAGDVGGGSFGTGLLQEDSVVTSQQEASLSEPSVGLSGDRELLTAEAQQLLSNDIRSGTKSIYRARFNHFATYCSDIGVDPHSCSESVILNFLTRLRKTYSYKYQTIAGYRSAISKYHEGFNGIPIGQAKNVKRLTRAVFIGAPPIAKYATIWSADKVLSHLRTLVPHQTLSDYQLGMKTLALISFASLSRSSSVAQLGPDVQCVGDKIVFSLMGLEKTSRPGHLRSELSFLVDKSDSGLDIQQCCLDYLARTEQKRVYYAAGEGRSPDRLFISNNKVRVF